MSANGTFSFDELSDAEVNEALDTDGRGGEGIYPAFIRNALRALTEANRTTGSFSQAWADVNAKAKSRGNVIQGMNAAAKRLTSDGTFKGYRVKIRANSDDSLITVYCGTPAK